MDLRSIDSVCAFWYVKKSSFEALQKKTSRAEQRAVYCFARRKKKGYWIVMANKKHEEIDDKIDNSELDLDVVLSEIGNEGSIVVARKEPDWCKGHIRTLQINAGEPISMDTLAAKFGGEKLYLRIYNSKGMIARRVVDICAPPRNGFGVELVLGPRGNVIPLTQLESENARYLQKNPAAMLPGGAFAPPSGAPPSGAPSAPANDAFMEMLKNQNAQTMQLLNMFLTRIGVLETMLQQRDFTPAAAPALPAYDPLSQLQNTVTVIGQLDKIKRSMIDDRPPEDQDGGVYTQIINKFLELAIAQKGGAPPGAPPGAPAYALQSSSPIPPGALGALANAGGAPPGAPLGSPPRAAPAAAPAAGPLDLAAVSNDQLIAAVFARLPALSDAERLKYAQEILGETIELEGSFSGDDGGDDGGDKTD
jgi:hypothetical protein